MQKKARYIKKSAAFMRVLHNEKHASATCLPERIRRFYISDARSLICKNGNTSVALPSYSPEADRCSRVFLRTILTGFFHKHSSGRRIAVTSLPRPPEIPCFFFPQSCRASSISTLPAVALPSHLCRGHRKYRVFSFHKAAGLFP